MQGHREQVGCWTSVAVTALENRVLTWGSPGSSHTIQNVNSINFFAWSFIADINLNFAIEVSCDPSFATFDTFLTQSNSPDVITTTYLMAGGNRDFIVIPYPFMRLRLSEPDNQASTYTRFTFKGWS